MLRSTRRATGRTRSSRDGSTASSTRRSTNRSTRRRRPDRVVRSDKAVHSRMVLTTSECHCSRLSSRSSRRKSVRVLHQPSDASACMLRCFRTSQARVPPPRTQRHQPHPEEDGGASQRASQLSRLSDADHQQRQTIIGAGPATQIASWTGQTRALLASSNAATARPERRAAIQRC